MTREGTISFYAFHFLFFFFLDNYHVQVNYIIGDIREIGSLFLYSVG